MGVLVFYILPVTHAILSMGLVPLKFNPNTIFSILVLSVVFTWSNHCGFSSCCSNKLSIPICSRVGTDVTHLAFFENDISDWYMYPQPMFHTVVVFLKKWA